MAGLHQVDTPHDADADTGTLVLVVRKDAESAADIASADGRFAPLSVTTEGFLRVDVPEAGVRLERTPTVESLLAETNSLLRRLVLAVEIMTGQTLNDPQ